VAEKPAVVSVAGPDCPTNAQPTTINSKHLAIQLKNLIVSIKKYLFLKVMFQHKTRAAKNNNTPGKSKQWPN
jgi:hypothetical protein